MCFTLNISFVKGYKSIKDIDNITLAAAATITILIDRKNEFLGYSGSIITLRLTTRFTAGGFQFFESGRGNIIYGNKHL